jgi:hypothetical protein
MCIRVYIIEYTYTYADVVRGRESRVKGFYLFTGRDWKRGLARVFGWGNQGKGKKIAAGARVVHERLTTLSQGLAHHMGMA